MNRNTIRFSAFGIFVGAIYVLSISLIALAYVYDCIWCWIFAISISVVIFQIHKPQAIKYQRYLKQDSMESKIRDKTRVTFRPNQYALKTRNAAPEKQALLQNTKQPAIALQQLLPGLPPICAN
jgi:hypothetical protein